MKRFKSIICVLDNDKEDRVVVQRASRLAATNGAKLDVVVCLEGMPDDQAAPEPLIADVWSSLRNEWLERLAHAVEPCRNQGIEVTSGVLGGIPFLEIIQRAEGFGHDLLIKPAQAIGGTRDLLFGSTDLHLMRKCPCPVWIHKPAEGGRYRQIMAAIDVTGETPHQNRLILDLATSLAAREEAEVHVVHAWRVPGEMAARGRAFIRMVREQVEFLVSAEEERRRAALDVLLAPYREQGFTPQDHLLKGDARMVIPELADTLEVDLIVMGTVGRSGVPGLLMGNTAEDILRQVDCSVLTVKPEGFVSPVAAEG